MGEQASERAREPNERERANAGRVGLSGREDLSRSTRQKSSPFIHPSIQPASQPGQASHPTSRASRESQPSNPSIHRAALLSVGESVSSTKVEAKRRVVHLPSSLYRRNPRTRRPPCDFSRPPAGSGRPLSSTTCVRLSLPRSPLVDTPRSRFHRRFVARHGFRRKRGAATTTLSPRVSSISESNDLAGANRSRPPADSPAPILRA